MQCVPFRENIMETGQPGNPATARPVQTRPSDGRAVPWTSRFYDVRKRSFWDAFNDAFHSVDSSFSHAHACDDLGSYCWF